MVYFMLIFLIIGLKLQNLLPGGCDNSRCPKEKRSIMIKTSTETKVGILFFLTLVIVGIFVYLLGVFNPFTPTYRLHVLYNYAGGLSIGSPVRVAGVKIGRVSDISFKPSSEISDLKILVTLLLKKSVKYSIKKDAEFFINMSGLIGEKYIEIKPGTLPLALLENETVSGIDPPRIDQLISQSYDLFSKIEKIVIDNKGNFTRALTIIENLSHSIDGLFKSTTKRDSQNIRHIISNVRKITSDLQLITGKTKASVIPILINLEPTIQSVKNASRHIEKFSEFLSALNKTDKANFENAVKNLSQITHSLNKLAVRTEELLKKFPDLNIDEFKTIFSETGIKVRLF